MQKTFKKLSVKKISENFRDGVETVQVPLVPPQDDQALVKIIYVGINSGDANMAAARYTPSVELPFDIGAEAVGVIEQVGNNITKFKVGDSVVVFGFPPKNFAEYVYANQNDLISILSIKPEFTALMCSGLTACIGLDQSGRIKKGDKVLITAAAGGTGHIGVQWAKQKGCYVIGMTSSPEKAKLLTDLGCDRVINYKTESLDEVLTKEYPEGIDVIWDMIGGEVFETYLKHLASKGRIVMVGDKAGASDLHISNISTFAAKNQILTGFMLLGFADIQPKYLKQLIGDIVNKKVKVIVDFGKSSTDGEFFGLDSIVRAIEHLQSGRNIGKVAVKIQNE